MLHPIPHRVLVRELLVDVDPATLNVDPEAVERAIGPKTKAVIGVHLFGCPCEIERLRETLGDRFCRQCEYCRPCPQGINIPHVNLMEAWVKQIPAEGLSQVFGGLVDKARDCVECRECVAKCPYDLPIPEMLRENITLYERVVGV